jgi:hypothetical protein
MSKNFTAPVAATSTAVAKLHKPRTTTKSVPVIMNNAETIGIEADEFSALMADLGFPDTAPNTVIEPDEVTMLEIAPSSDTVTVATSDSADDLSDLDALLNDPVIHAPEIQIETEISDAALEAAVSSAEATEVMMASATPEGVFEGAAPTDGAIGGAIGSEVPVKKERVPRKHYSDKVERLKDRVGASLAEYTVLTTADALVDEEELGKVMERTLEIIRGMNSKEKNRASNFIEFLSGKKAKLNNVLERVLGVLDRDGFIQTGNDGNVIKDLIARPYSIGSARAMGGNTIGVYADLKVILPDGKGRFVPNPDSLLLAKARSMLAVALPTPAGDAEIDLDAAALA